MANVEKVKEIMKYIENLQGREEYSSFEVATLIASRSDLNHSEITSELVRNIEYIADGYDTLLDESLIYDIEDEFNKFVEKQKVIATLKLAELKKYIENYGWQVEDGFCFKDKDSWIISTHTQDNKSFSFLVLHNFSTSQAIDRIKDYAEVGAFVKYGKDNQEEIELIKKLSDYCSKYSVTIESKSKELDKADDYEIEME